MAPATVLTGQDPVTDDAETPEAAGLDSLDGPDLEDIIDPEPEDLAEIEADLLDGDEDPDLADVFAELDELDQPAPVQDLVRIYLNQIGRRDLLTAEDEVELSKLIEIGLMAEYYLGDPDEVKQLPALLVECLEIAAEEGRQAKTRMIESNLRLVVSVAKRYRGKGMLFLDLIQEGNLGLIRAVEKFDYTKSIKFSTYGIWWIKQAITRALADQARAIRLPVYIVEQVNKLLRVQRELIQRLGREPTVDELAAELEVKPAKVNDLLEFSRDMLSLNAEIGDEGNGSEFGDAIEDIDAIIPDDYVTQVLHDEETRRRLELLNEREAQVISLRLGLYDGHPRTLDETSRYIPRDDGGMGVTRERVRQLEKRALTKLRVHAGVLPPEALPSPKPRGRPPKSASSTERTRGDQPVAQLSLAAARGRKTRPRRRTTAA